VIVQVILERIMQGEVLTKICSEEGMPAWQTYYGWMNSRPEMKEGHAHARLAWSDYWAERALTMSLDGSNDVFIDGETGKAVIDHAAVQRSRLAVDTIKWLTSKYAKKVYGDRPEPDEAPKELSISWQKIERTIVSPDDSQPRRYEAPRQIEYRKPELPADLTEADWSVMLEVLELVKRTGPTNDERPPQEIFGVMRKALLAHFAEVMDSK
jgi:hypothetical protein